LPQDKLVLLTVTPESVADLCGIKDNDVLQYFGVVYTAELENFTLTEVEKKDGVKEAFHQLKSSPNSVGLVLVVKRSGTTTLA